MRPIRPVVLYALSCISLLPLSVGAAYLDLPKTGQTISYAKLDDGDIEAGAKWPEARFIDNADGTITDKLTNLMWMKDASCADTSGFISGNNVTRWQQSFEFIDKLNGEALNIPCQQYTKKYNDWRIPTVTELTTLLRAGLTAKTNAEWLNVPGTPSSGFINTGFVHDNAWTSTTAASDNTKAWVVNLMTGAITLADKANDKNYFAIFSAVRATKEPVLIAKSGQTVSYAKNDDATATYLMAPPVPRFIDRDNGTVIDRLSGLMWLKDATCVSPLTAWSTANGALETPNFTKCNGYTAKHTGWRLPNVKELQSLIDYGQSGPALPKDHPFIINTSQGATFWTGTSANGDPNSFAWTVSFTDGQTLGNTSKNASNILTWPVRTPTEYADLNAYPALVDFGEAFVGQEQIAPRVITITSTGSKDLNLGNLQIDDTQAERLEFTLGHDTCSGKTLSHQETCIVEIVFKPRQTGTRHTTLRIPSDALGLPLIETSITGVGLSAIDPGNTACFIATAAYGSFLEPEVQALRSFRDEYLLPHEFGKWAVARYYEYSPPFAHWIAEHELAKTLVRAFLTPIVYAVKYPVMATMALLLFITLGIAQRRRSKA